MSADEKAPVTRWGRTHYNSHYVHLRADRPDPRDPRVGPSACGDWLVDDSPSPVDTGTVRPCARCLAHPVDPP